MDFYGISGDDNRIGNEFLRLHKTLDYCGQECDSIKRKLGKASVPSGKKEKLVYRLKVLTTRVMPRLTEKMRQLSELT